MSTDHLVVMSVPGLRPQDVTAANTPTLHTWAVGGAIAELTPTFPCVTSPVQASMFTGRPPREHGVIANGFYDRAERSVEFWVGWNDRITGEQVWDAARARDPNATSAVWHAQNIKGASADYIITPAPIHEADGTTKLWCYSKPDGTYQAMVDSLGHFPLQHYWGPLSNINSTRWILRGALWLMERHRPNLHWIYIPHLDYASQKFGPNSPQAVTALRELDAELAVFASEIPRAVAHARTTFLVVGEYAMTDVTRVAHPNRIMREAGLLKVRDTDGGELPDLTASRAFAMVDHQFAHVFVEPNDATQVAAVRDLLGSQPGVALALAGDERRSLGMDHPRCGDVVLVSEDDAWFSYYWWLDDARAPGFARTVDIHQKPGYDPVELFFDPATRGIPLNAELVKGSHGVPATKACHRAALVCSNAEGLGGCKAPIRDTDVKRVCLALLGN